MKQAYYIVIFIGFIVSYFLIYGFYGYNDADDGYVFSYSWRIFNGEIPYKDFIYTKPPFTPLFHTLTLYLIPENYQVIFERFLFYVLIALSALFCSLTIDKAFTLKDYQINPYLLATVGFVFSVRNLPPMPWQTVDGIFFASLGIFSIIRYTTIYSIVLAMLFLFFSALCKQSFYLMPFAGVAFIMITSKDWRKPAVSILSLSLLIAAFLLTLYKLRAIASFINLTSGVTKIVDLYHAGVLRYFQADALPIIASFGIWVIAYKLSNIIKLPRIIELVPYFFISLLLLYPMEYFYHYVLYNSVKYIPAHSAFFMDDASRLLFILSIFLFVLNFSLEKKWVSLWLLALLSWCASISFGYQTPAFFSTPLLFAFFIVAHQYFSVQNLTKLAIFTLLIGTFTYYLAYEKPDCNPLKSELTYEISDIFPKLKFIKVGRDTYEKYHDFKFLVNKYGSNFKTLPGMPLAHYLTNTKCPLPIDWVYNFEINYQNDEILKVLSDKKPFVFVEKEPQQISVENDKGMFTSQVTFFIKSNWVKIDSTRHFDIYKTN